MSSRGHSLEEKCARLSLNTLMPARAFLFLLHFKKQQHICEYLSKQVFENVMSQSFPPTAEVVWGGVGVGGRWRPLVKFCLTEATTEMNYLLFTDSSSVVAW